MHYRLCIFQQKEGLSWVVFYLFCLLQIPVLVMNKIMAFSFAQSLCLFCIFCVCLQYMLCQGFKLHKSLMGLCIYKDVSEIIKANHKTLLGILFQDSIEQIIMNAQVLEGASKNVCFIFCLWWKLATTYFALVKMLDIWGLTTCKESRAPEKPEGLEH